MREKTVVVIPGSKWQIPIVTRLKNEGYRTLVINPYKDSPAFPYADGHLEADIFNADAVIGYCKREHADAIISEECDIAMLALANYGKILGFSTLSVESAALYTNKVLMRDFCRDNGIPHPEYKLCKSMNEAIKFFETLKTKMIMKPLDSNSSRGVYTVANIDDIKRNFQDSLLFSRTEKAVLLERYIDGPEFTIDGIKTPDKHFSLMISEKKHYAHNDNIAHELYFSHENSRYDYSLLKKVNDSFVDKSPLNFGLTHAEYKYENGQFYLIEIAARGGGNLMSSHIVPFMSGIDNYKYLIDCSLGNIANADFSIKAQYLKRVAVLKFFDTPEHGGIVKEIQGLDYLKSTPEIIQYSFNFKVGDRIGDAKDDSSRIGFYIACCESKEKLESVMYDVKEKVRICLTNGEKNRRPS